LLGAWFRSGLLADESGSVTILVAISLITTLGIMGLAIDVGQLRLAKQQLQMTADAAALAGALELSSCGGSANCSVLKAAAQDALTENNLGASTFVSAGAKIGHVAPCERRYMAV